MKSCVTKIQESTTIGVVIQRGDAFYPKDPEESTSTFRHAGDFHASGRLWEILDGNDE
jgi:hypothetical protein